MKIKAVLFDLIGTTVKEKDPAFINNCFEKAFFANGIHVNAEMIKPHRGKDKMDIIKNLLNELNQPLNTGDKILNDYKTILENNMDNFSEIEGFREIMSYLKGKKMLSGLGTGLSRDFLDKLISFLGWNNAGFNYIAASEEVGNGRPHPEMIYDMMKRLDIHPEEMLKIGDTFSDIQEGKNAGVKTVVILSGTQDKSVLRSYKPDYIIKSLIELKEIIL